LLGLQGIGDDPLGFASALAHAMHDLFQGITVHIDTDDCPPFCADELRRGPSYTTPGARNQRYLVTKSHNMYSLLHFSVSGDMSKRHTGQPSGASVADFGTGCQLQTRSSGRIFLSSVRHPFYNTASIPFSHCVAHSDKRGGAALGHTYQC
jgi:hypothetical protein